MRYKIISCILAIMLILPSIPAFAADYDYEFTESYTSSLANEGESDVIIPYTYFSGSEFDNIPEIAVTKIVVGGEEGRGTLNLRNWPGDSVSTVIQCPNNPGDPPVGEQIINQSFARWQVFSLYADEGELFFKEISGIVYTNDNEERSFIIRFSGSGGGTDPDPPDDPDDPEPPEEVENVEVDTKAGDIIVNWDTVDGADGYYVYINGDRIDVGDNTEYIYRAQPGEYEIEVSAYNEDGESDKSDPISIVRPEDNPIIIITPPSCEPPPVLDVNIIGVEKPIPIYFPDPPSPPSAPDINPLPNPSSYVPDDNDFDMKPDMPDYNPRHYDPIRDGEIFEYEPPPLDIPDSIESPSPLPSMPDPIIMPHDDPIEKEKQKEIEAPYESEIPVNPSGPIIPDEPKEPDPVTANPIIIEPPRDTDQINIDPPRELDPIRFEPPRGQMGYAPEPPREMDPPRTPE